MHVLYSVHMALVLGTLYTWGLYWASCTHGACTRHPVHTALVLGVLYTRRLYSASCTHGACTGRPVHTALVLGALYIWGLYSAPCTHGACTGRPVHMALVHRRPVHFIMTWYHAGLHSGVNCRYCMLSRHVVQVIIGQGTSFTNGCKLSYPCETLTK